METVIKYWSLLCPTTSRTTNLGQLEWGKGWVVFYEEFSERDVCSDVTNFFMLICNLSSLNVTPDSLHFDKSFCFGIRTESILSSFKFVSLARKQFTSFTYLFLFVYSICWIFMYGYKKKMENAKSIRYL